MITLEPGRIYKLRINVTPLTIEHFDYIANGVMLTAHGNGFVPEIKRGTNVIFIEHMNIHSWVKIIQENIICTVPANTLK